MQSGPLPPGRARGMLAGMTRRLLLAPDKFKGSLSAGEVVDALAAGLGAVLPDWEIDRCPIADGGEGFMEAMSGALGGRWVECAAVDALDRPIRSRYLLAETAEGLTAVIEMAETAGMWRLRGDELNPLAASTRGVGMQIAHAVREQGAERVTIGLGGSATNDAGCGMAAELGYRFLDAGGGVLHPSPAGLAGLVTISREGAMALPPVRVACDVDHPLLGIRGCTEVFSPQKGSTAETRPLLEESLTRLVGLSGPRAAAAAEVPGAGAAGGLGFGLLHFADARLVAGFDLVARLLDLPGRVAAADHVITGEGMLDAQSLGGKGPVGLARLAAEQGVPASAFCGQATAEIREAGLFRHIHALADSGLPLEVLLREAGPMLREAAAEFARGPLGA